MAKNAKDGKVKNNTRRNGNGKNYGRDGKDRDSKKSNKRFSSNESFDCESPTASNDVSWYGANPAIIRDVASFPFSNVLRDRITWYNGLQEANQVTPGICTFATVPTIGKSDDASDAITVAARSIYSFVRHANSGHANYDAPDLMLYLLAMDNAYMLWSHLVRAYGVARTFNQKNRYYPNAALKAMGFDADSVTTNLAELRALINYMAVKLSSFAVPTVMPYFRRHLWMYQNIFLDRPSGKAQSYMFVPQGFYKYNEVSGMGQLDWTDWNVAQNPLNFRKALRDYVDSFLAPIFASEDMGIMSGDILKAYGPSNLFAFMPIDENYTVIPTYAEGIMPQIHNCKPVDCTVGSITQDVDGVLHQSLLTSAPVFKWSNPDFIINMPMENPTPEDVIYATRLCANKDLEHNRVGVMGSEIIVRVYLWYLESGTPHSIPVPVDSHYDALYATGQVPEFDSDIEYTVTADKIKLFGLVHQFNGFPIMYRHFLVAEGTNWATATNKREVSTFFDCDLQNFTVIKSDSMEAMHEAAIASEFGIPYTLTRA